MAKKRTIDVTPESVTIENLPAVIPKKRARSRRPEQLQLSGLDMAIETGRKINDNAEHLATGLVAGLFIALFSGRK